MNSAEALMLVKKYTFKCLGCTDPVAIALATATALQAVGGKPLKVTVEMDRNVYKNAFAVEIPGGFGAGFSLAAAAGLVVANTTKGLLFLEGIKEEEVKQAKNLVESGIINCILKRNIKGPYVKAKVRTDQGIGTAIINGAHDNVVLIRKNNKVLLNKNIGKIKKQNELQLFGDILKLDELVEIVEGIPAAELTFLADGIKINLHAANQGMDRCPGLGIGNALSILSKSAHNSHINYEGIVSTAKMLTAAATDARMAGMNIPIIGCFGSGNHGITLFISLGVLFRYQQTEETRLLKALAIGSLLVGMVKQKTGILTPHCGCALAAGVGAAGGAAYLMGGNPNQIELAALLVIANIFGMVCDGAKPSCALKVSTAAGVALESAYIALNSNPSSVVKVAGIVGGSLKEALNGIEELTKKGFSQVDDSIISILQKRI